MLIARHHVMGKRRGDGMERSAYLLLTRLEVEGPMSIGQLAEAFRLDTSTVNRQVAALLRAGDAERIADPEGGLARKLRITEDGVGRLASEREMHCEGLERVLASWDESERRELFDVLTRFNRSVEGVEGREWPRHDLTAERGGGAARG
ncbi:MarR family winged helix-turn-helix transcriptional regulator [Embleya sp. NBC_00896]|uniref:MarR family winged helix-turn-helix transcriptional regulator n=1 Tax=Embleya sp. NBC_00896 TaxID=2975961 RepID=UPI0038631B8D